MKRFCLTIATLAVLLASADYARSQLPGAIGTPQMTATGVAGSAAGLPGTVNAPALTATGVAGPASALPAAINTPGLSATGIAP